MSHIVDIIIPTYDNPNFIIPCVNSILNHTMSREAMKIIVVNNGRKEIEDFVTKHPLVKIIHSEKNLGWEGGLKLGLANSKAPYVCFMNDDTYIPYSSSKWIIQCLSQFHDLKVAAVGPSSNVVRGYQNIFMDQFAGYHSPYAPFLIGFCVFLRRSYLDQVGGVDETLPGGDDFDLSIRLRKAGYKLVIARDTFVYHHGFQTGVRVKGNSDRPGGWNSVDMTEKTNAALIKKHGFKVFMDCNHSPLENPDAMTCPSRQNEIEVVKLFIKPGVIYDLGCGASKTVPEAIGIDIIKLGDPIPNLEGQLSQADIVSDVSSDLPIKDESADTIITRHILEHCIDIVSTLRLWMSKMKPDGRLILCVPDERITTSIPLNPEHRHAFTPESLKAIADLVGLKQVEMRDNYNGISFTSVFEKSGVLREVGSTEKREKEVLCVKSPYC